MTIAAWKVSAALAAGCTVVLKPPPEAPLSNYLLVEALEEAGVPAGVINLVPGGREVGEHLVTHPGTDKIAFTGSTAAGKRIMSLCGDQVKRVSLELGGKSAAIVLDDADIDAVVPRIVAGVMHLSGQVCGAHTRVLVPRGSLRRGRRRSPRPQPMRSRSATPTIRPPSSARWSPSVSASGSRSTSPRRPTRAPGSRPAAARPAHLPKGWYVDAHDPRRRRQLHAGGP